MKRWHWPFIWVFVALLWALSAYNGELGWSDIALGFITGVILACWAIDFTGDKVPEWLYGSTSRPNRKP